MTNCTTHKLVNDISAYKHARKKSMGKTKFKKVYAIDTIYYLKVYRSFGVFWGGIFLLGFREPSPLVVFCLS
jgi:hypothetical protein